MCDVLYYKFFVNSFMLYNFPLIEYNLIKNLIILNIF